MSNSEDTKPEHLWKPGVSGNPAGRPKGARSKLAERFVEDVLKDWEESGLVTLQELRRDKPDVYVKVVADLLPKIEHKTEDVNVTHNGTIVHRSVPEIAGRITELLGAGAAGTDALPRPH